MVAQRGHSHSAIGRDHYIVGVGRVVVALCLRVRQTRHNNKERRRLTKRVAWHRDLLQLLPPSSAPPASEEEKEKGGASARASTSTTTATAAQGVRTVLAKRIEATVSEVDRLAKSMSSCCYLLGFARSYNLAKRLKRANEDVDEVYTHLLPVVTQIDATHRVEQVLVGVMQLQQEQQGGHDGNLAANKNNHSDAQRPARPNGSTENIDDQASTVSGTTVDR